MAKAENHDPEVSLDLQLRAVFAAHPAARRDFQGLVRKWSSGTRPAAAGEARARR